MASGADTPTAAAAPRGMGVPGVLVVTAGVILLLISFSSLTWYHSQSDVDSVGTVRFAELRRLAAATDASGLTGAYFAWLAWILLLALIVVGFAANAPWPASTGLRAVGLLLGAVGAATTFSALRGIVVGGDVFHGSGVGVWLAIAGYPVCGIGAAFGPVRRRAPREV